MSAHCEKCGIELGLELDCWACDLRAERDRYREALERAQDTFHWIQFDAASFMAASQAASKAEADARAALEGDKDE